MGKDCPYLVVYLFGPLRPRGVFIGRDATIQPYPRCLLSGQDGELMLNRRPRARWPAQAFVNSHRRLNKVDYSYVAGNRYSSAAMAQ